jgi:hypothetical protein
MLLLVYLLFAGVHPVASLPDLAGVPALASVPELTGVHAVAAIPALTDDQCSAVVGFPVVAEVPALA